MTRLPFPMWSERQRLAKLLRGCSKNSLQEQGVQVHAVVLKTGFGFDLMLNNDLINMYAKCGKMNMASYVFDRMLERNVVSWTALMWGHLQHGNAKGSLLLFHQILCSTVKANEFTLSTNFKACGVLGIPENGLQIHAMCVKSGFETAPVVSNSMMDMYSKCGRIEAATRIFNVLSEKNLISWNTMIAGYSLAGYGKKALELFYRMQKNKLSPDEYTLTSVLKACVDLDAIREGSIIHGLLITRGYACKVMATVAGALIDLYVKCGNLLEACKVFDQIEEKSAISWSALILGHAREGNLTDAIDLFTQLRTISIQVDSFVLSSMIGVFADFALVEQGKQIHAYAIKLPSGLEMSASNSIIDLYLKCGLLDEAERFFSKMPKKNVVSWTVLITGYGKHGLGSKAVDSFNGMRSNNIEPDSVTYLAILSACSHSGLIDEGEVYFSQLLDNRQTKPRIEHYSCMVDLLGRAGRLKQAKYLIETMPLKPNLAIWQTLLSACRVHGDLQLGREVGEILLRLDGDNPANYVMISNMYAESGNWRTCEKVRETVKRKGLKKEAGRSWVEINKEIHIFYGGDDRHPLTEKIHEVLNEMVRRMKQELGYIPKVRFALRDVEEESREDSLRVHSEKLAIGLALLHGAEEEGRVIRIFKNLRICGDCHEFIKGLSEILKVVFWVRDANRFHHFKDGQCSCKDFW